MANPESPAASSASIPTPALVKRYVRDRAFLIALVAVLVIAAVGQFVDVDYVALGPGPVTNTLGLSNGKPLIQVSGLKTYPTSGVLDLTTVEVQPSLTMFQALTDWFDPHKALLPRELIYPKNETTTQVDNENQTEMADSRVDAVSAVLAKLGLLKVVVSQVESGYPAASALKAGDRILAINGQPVRSAYDVQVDVGNLKVGQRASVRFVRAGVTRTVVLRTVGSPQDKTHPVIGVQLSEPTVNPKADVKIVGLDQVGGPSAGLMFALGVYDTLTPGDLTGGKTIVGTGTIDEGGNVGAIGGIELKMIAARHTGATWFLTPSDNCAEALRSVPKGLHLAKVSTLDQAIADVKAIASGNSAIPAC